MRWLGRLIIEFSCRDIKMKKSIWEFTELNNINSNISQHRLPNSLGPIKGAKSHFSVLPKLGHEQSLLVPDIFGRFNKVNSMRDNNDPPFRIRNAQRCSQMMLKMTQKRFTKTLSFQRVANAVLVNHDPQPKDEDSLNSSFSKRILESYMSF